MRCTLSPSSVVLLVAATTALAQWDASRYAWFSSSAGTNFHATLPIGNGRLGAAIYGGAKELLTLNENSMWSGPFTDRSNGNSAKNLNNIRQQLTSGSISAAG